MRKNMVNEKKFEAGNFIGVFFVTLLLVISATSIAVSSEGLSDFGDRPAKWIVGSASRCDGGSTTGASVLAQASGLPDETTTVESTSWWQLDISGDGGQTEWPDGTSFTVTITQGSWSGTGSGTVSGTTTNIGDVELLPPTLVATANGNPTTIMIGGTVSFTGSATGGATPYTSWYWDFKDGGSSTQQSTSHQFNSQGTFNVELTVTDSCFNTDSDNVLITVNAALSCDAGGPYSGTVCNPVSFSGSASGGIPPYTYSWTFGDGGSGSGQTPSHQYTSDGIYTATLTVTDSNSGTDIDTATVTISTSDLVANSDGPYSGTMCNPVSFSGSATGGCSPYSYSWDFGDGGSGTGQNPSHQYTADDTYTVTLTVTDDASNTDIDTATVTISTTPLVANAGGPYSGYQNDLINFYGSASGGCSPYSYSWNFGDGNSSTDQNPTHVYTSVGTYDVTLTVTDDYGKTDNDDTTATISEGTPDLSCAGSLSWKTKSQGTVTGSFSLSNIGDPGTNLDWEIDSYPEWGSWTFTPEQDDDLTPEAGATTVQVTVVAPQEKQEFSGKVKVINKENPSDFCEISVSLTVPKVRPYSPMLEFLQLLAQKMPMLRLVLEILQSI